MKKVLAVLLSVMMLFGVGMIGATAAEEEENLCEVFESELWSLCGAPYPYDLETILSYTCLSIPDPWDYLEIEPDEFTYTYPADIFEETAASYFEVSTEDLHSANFDEITADENIYGSFRYDAESNTYILKCHIDIDIGLTPDGYWDTYNIIGYEKNGADYDVYFAEETVGLNGFYDSAEDFLADLGKTKEELGDAYRETYYDESYEELAGTWECSYVATGKYEKFTVSYNGEQCRVKNNEKMTAAPDTDNLITPDYDVNAPKVEYDTPDDVTVEGDSSFPANTLIKVEHITSGAIYERAEKALQDIADKDKIAVFAFTATMGDTAVQPVDKVKVTFDLPANLSADNLKMFNISADGKNEPVDITVDKNSKTAVANLEQLGTYVLCNGKSADNNNGSTNTGNGNKNNNINSNSNTNSVNKIPETGDTTNIALPVAVMLASLFALVFLAYSKKKHFNK